MRCEKRTVNEGASRQRVWWELAERVCIFLTVRGIWPHSAALFKHAVKSAGAGCVDYCRRLLRARITPTDSAPPHVWRQVRQRSLSICVTIFWLAVSIHFTVLWNSSLTACLHLSSSFWLCCDACLCSEAFLYIPQQRFWVHNMCSLCYYVLPWIWEHEAFILPSFLVPEALRTWCMMGYFSHDEGIHRDVNRNLMAKSHTFLCVLFVVRLLSEMHERSSEIFPLKDV